MLSLIDADIVAFRCASSAEKENEVYIPIARCAELVETILRDTEATGYRLFLTHSDRERNFRRKLYPAYKQQRDSKPSPRWLSACREFLINEWDAEVCDGYEADDGLGIAMSQGSEQDMVCCSIDKDLRQLAGNHYNFVTKQAANISKEAGLRTFYEQLLIGDPVDNIKGAEGIGKAKAPRILEGCNTEDEMFEAVRDVYKNDNLMKLNGQLLWIWRKENDIWTHPKFESGTSTEQGTESK